MNKSYLKLLSVPGLGTRRITRLIEHFGSCENVLTATPDEICTINGFERKLAHIITSHDGSEFAEFQIEQMVKNDIQLVCILDGNYPKRLKQIYSPPAVLFYKGDLSVFDKPSLAIVGTRRITAYGKAITEEFSSKCAQHGLTTVSGFARGVDTICHISTIKIGGKTGAVFGSGLDVIYPAENRKLFEQVVQNGCIVSEFPMGTKPDAGNFPQRNRIISGLTLGVLVIEAGKRSGALITSAFASDQNREVFAIPGAVNSQKSIGTNRLIQRGHAKAILDFQDILDEFEFLNVSNKTMSLPLPDTLPEKEQNILKVLTEIKHIDDIAEKIAIEPQQLLSQLLYLELRGYVRQHPGKHFESLLKFD